MDYVDDCDRGYFIDSREFQEEEDKDDNDIDNDDSNSFIDNGEIEDQNERQGLLSNEKNTSKKKICQATLSAILKELKLLTPYNINGNPTLDSFEVWHLQVVCRNFQQSIQQYTRRGISDIFRSVERFIAELNAELDARKFWCMTDEDDTKTCLLLTKNYDKRDMSSLVEEMKNLERLREFKELEPGSFVSHRNIDQFLKEEGKTKKELMAAVRMEEPHPLLLQRGEARENKLMQHFETWHIIYFCRELQHWLVYYQCKRSWFMKDLLFFMKQVIEGHRGGLSVPSPPPFLKAPPHDIMVPVPTLAEEMRMQSKNELEMTGGGWH